MCQAFDNNRAEIFLYAPHRTYAWGYLNSVLHFCQAYANLMTEKVQTTTLRYCQCEFTAIFWFCVDDATHNLQNCCLLFFELHGVTQSHCIRSIHLSAHFYKCNCNFSQSAYFRLKNRNREIFLFHDENAQSLWIPAAQIVITKFIISSSPLFQEIYGTNC